MFYKVNYPKEVILIFAEIRMCLDSHSYQEK